MSGIELLSASLLYDMAIIVIAAAIFSVVAKMTKQPTMFAYILAGIVIGPLVLGTIMPTIFGIKIGLPMITDDISLLAELGVAFLLFSIGVEINFEKLMNAGKEIYIGAVLQVLLIIGFSILFSLITGILSFETGLFVGVILAFSSTMVVVKILSDKKEINTINGRLMIAFLLVQDFLVVLALPLLSNVSLLTNPFFIGGILIKSIGLIAFGAILSIFVFPKLFKRIVDNFEVLFLSSIAVCFIFVYVALILDIPMSIGAFIGGIALSTLPYSEKIFTTIKGLRDFFVTIFFVTIGTEISFQFSAIPVALIIFIFGTIFLLKPLIFYVITMIAGYGAKESAKVSLGLSQVSEFSFILAGIGLTQGILGNELFSLLILAIAFSMVLTPYSMKYSEQIIKLFQILNSKISYNKMFNKKFFYRKIDELQKVPRDFNEHTILIGAGTFGYKLAQGLNATSQIVVIDHDPEIVDSLNNENITAIYGSPESENILDVAKIEKAKVLVITIPSPIALRKIHQEQTLKLINEARILNKNVVIFAVAHYFYEALFLYEAGADYVAMPQIMGSNLFLKDILQYLDTGKLYHISNYKDAYVEYLKEKVIEEKKRRPYYFQ